jgi:tetratricopeptide (TPR) repeat protein
MARATLGLFSCAGLVLAVTALLLAAPEDNSDRVVLTLRIQSALDSGQQSLKSGHFREAVETLEKELGSIDGNHAYLNTLRDSYLGLIAELKQKNQPAEAARFRRRLEALDPGALLELKTANTATPAPAPPDNPPAKPSAVERPTPQRDSDPFSDANQVVVSSVRPLLDQAEAAFKAQKYEAASKLYEQVARADETAIGPARERWGYCKRHGIPQQQMEREARLAMSMNPKLQEWGQNLLRKIQEQQVAAPPGNPETPDEAVPANGVRHLPNKIEGWAVAESTNFRIFHKDVPEQADRVGRAAESARAAASRKWFGEVAPTWSPRCEVYLHVNREEYSQATKQPPDCPGHSTIGAKEGSDHILSRRIDLHMDDPNMVIGVVPHETTHVVLAGRFGAQPLPRWADEGMAVLSEPRDRVERHLRNLPQHQHDHQLFAMADLMQFGDYPEGKYIGAFYAQSVSLVDFLCQQKNGPQGFTAFMRDGMRGGFEPALKQHYGLKSFVELQQRWQTATLRNGAQTVAAARGQ